MRDTHQLFNAEEETSHDKRRRQASERHSRPVEHKWWDRSGMRKKVSERGGHSQAAEHRGKSQHTKEMRRTSERYSLSVEYRGRDKSRQQKKACE
jgi:hypothetical protein